MDFKIKCCYFLNKDDSTILFLLTSVQLEYIPRTDISVESAWIFTDLFHLPWVTP